MSAQAFSFIHLVKGSGKYIIKKITQSTISKAIKAGCMFLFWQIGPTVLLTSPPGIATTALIGTVVFGTSLIENTITNKVITE
jgi:hypothetical protein